MISGRLLLTILHEAEKKCTFKEFVEKKYLPFCQRKWKESTTTTSKERISYRLTRDLGMFAMSSFSREQLQDFLDKKAAKLPMDCRRTWFPILNGISARSSSLRTKTEWWNVIRHFANNAEYGSPAGTASHES
jgi:hypothetical protein